jgi:beta-fructofuranosidase
LHSRPRYHYTAPQNWLNDPNGVAQWRGRYHLFYQYSPDALSMHRMRWGHAVSPDLVHWEHLPIALEPSPGPDVDGCWSGCMVVADGTPHVIYSGYHDDITLPCLAVATDLDELVTWRKHEGNPVIQLPDGLDVVGFRDHTVWREDGWYHQLVGSGLRDVAGCVFHFRSRDLVDWEPLGVFLTGLDTASGRGTEMWECPDFFPLGDRHVLVVSAYEPGQGRRILALVGDYADGRFRVTSEQVIDWRGHYYAPQSFEDESGRRIMHGWVTDPRPEAMREASGWSGAIAVPRVLRLREDGRISSEPVPELDALRGAHRSISGRASTGRTLDAGSHPPALDVAVELAGGDAALAGLSLRAAGRDEETRVVIDRRLGVCRLERVVAGEVVRSAAGVHRPEGTDRLRVLLDGPIAEVFDQSGLALIGFMGAWDDAEAVTLSVWAEGGTVEVRSLETWAMGSAL